MKLKMNPRAKQAWVKALRSGKYKQGRGALRNCKNEYCVLGVLCDVHRKVTKNGYRWCTNSYTSHHSYFGQFTNIPGIVAKWAKLSPFLRNSAGEIRHLVGLNDDRYLTFREFADLIEKQL